MQKLSIILLALFLAGCAPSQPRMPSDQYMANNFPVPHGATQEAQTTNPPGYDEAKAESDEASDQCRADFKKKIIKTYYAKNKCQTDAMRKYIGRFFANQDAFRHYITKRLLLAIQLDKKQVTRDEAGVMGDDLWNDLLSAENTTRSAMNTQVSASVQAQAQQDTARNIAILNALKQPFDAQRQWVNQQNSSIINCNSGGGVTGCRQGY